MSRCLPTLLIISTLLACTSDKLRRNCGDDGDCDDGFICEMETGSCVCESNDSCAFGEFCNGRTCQIQVGCETSFDCPRGTFCDRTSGNCLEYDLCTADVQCPFGFICDGVRFTCTEGCRDSGDCRLGHACRCPAGQSCDVGVCEEGPCDNDSFCRFGERCVEQSNGEKWCERDDRGPYCDGCAYQVGQVDRCPGTEPNFCLLNRKVEHYNTYCGVDCSDDQPCPWGYSCNDILRLTSALCKTDSDCKPKAGAASCETDDECRGARCDQETKRCAGSCSYNEDSKSGYCTCSQDSECPVDSCGADFRCTISRKSCTPGAGDCRIYCVDLGNRAACLVGKNCVPSEGLTCSEVRPGGSP